MTLKGDYLNYYNANGSNVEEIINEKASMGPPRFA